MRNAPTTLSTNLNHVQISTKYCKTFTRNFRQIQSAEDAQPNREETSAREKKNKNKNPPLQNNNALDQTEETPNPNSILHLCWQQQQLGLLKVPWHLVLRTLVLSPLTPS
jgi:hypothetical protein